MKAALIVIVADLALLSALPVLSSPHGAGLLPNMQAAGETHFDSDQSLEKRLEELEQRNEFLKQEAKEASSEAMGANERLFEAKTQLADAQQTVKQTSAELGTTKTQLADAQQTVKQTSAELGTTKTQLADAQQTVKQTSAELGTTKTQLADAQTENARLGQKVDTLKSQNQANEEVIAEDIARIEKLAGLTSITVQIGFDRGRSLRNWLASGGMITFSAPLIHFRDQTIVPTPCLKIESLKDATSSITMSVSDVWGQAIHGNAILVASDLDPRICGIRIDVPTSGPDAPTVEPLERLSQADLMASRPSALQIIYYEHDSEKSWQVDTKSYTVQPIAGVLTYDPTTWQVLHNFVFEDNAIGAYALAPDGRYVCVIVSSGICEMLDDKQIGSFKPLAWSGTDFREISQQMHKIVASYGKCSGQQQCQFAP